MYRLYTIIDLEVFIQDSATVSDDFSDVAVAVSLSGEDNR